MLTNLANVNQPAGWYLLNGLYILKLVGFQEREPDVKLTYR